MECIFSFFDLISFYFQIIKMECQAKKNGHFQYLFLFAFNQSSKPQKLLISNLQISNNEVLKILLNVGKNLLTTMESTLLIK